MKWIAGALLLIGFWGSLLLSGCASTPKRLECDCSASPNNAELSNLQGRAASLGRDVVLVQRAAPPEFHAELVEARRLIRSDEAREEFNVSGRGLTAAILDTGIRKTHTDFGNRVIVTKDFTSAGAGSDDAPDLQGHGTHVAGVVAANGRNRGIAPGASLVALKVLGDDGNGDFQWVVEALQWVIDHAAEHRISVVSMSLGADANVTSDDSSFWPEVSLRIQQQIQALTERRIAVVMAAGNSYFEFNSAQGMSFPAIVREGISVGAVYDANVGSQGYRSGATASSTDADHLSPFTQRLHPCVNPATCTDIFAPGAPMTSTGILTDQGDATMSGTSQATPTVTGVVLLLQELHQRRTGSLPTVEQLTRWLKDGAVRIVDGDDEKNNVKATGCDFYRVDALNALRRAAGGL